MNTTGTAAVCGIYDCSLCEHKSTGVCPGCPEGNERLVATDSACGVFMCVQAKGIESCTDCAEPACLLRRSVETICPVRSRFEKMRWWAGRMSRALETRKNTADEPTKRVSQKVVSRMRWYLTALDRLAAEGQESVSSWQLAQRVGVSAALIRKDFARFGDFGTPSYGYRVEPLCRQIRGILGLDRPRSMVWVGACSFRYSQDAMDRLIRNQCQILGVFEVAPAYLGEQIGDHVVQPVSKMAEVLAGQEVSVGVIAVPGAEAQDIAMSLVDMGAKAILNLSGNLLMLPDHVKVSSIDLMGELMELCFYCGESSV